MSMFILKLLSTIIGFINAKKYMCQKFSFEIPPPTPHARYIANVH